MPPNIESRLKLRQLALAIAILDTGSLRKASEALNITQPAATNALQELEFFLGAPLFDRSRSGMRPTIFGHRFVERARSILCDIRATAEEMQQLKDGDSGVVRIGTLPASAMTIIPEAMSLARRRKPGVRLHLIEGSTGQLLPALRQGDLDLVVGRIPSGQMGQQLHHEVLLTDGNEVVCRAGHRLAGRATLTLADLCGEDWILPEDGSYVRSEFRETFVSAGLQPPEPVVVTSSTSVRLALLSSTDMLCVLTRRAARLSEARGLVKVLDAGMKSRGATTVLVSREAAVIPPAALSFIACLKEAAASGTTREPALLAV